MQKSEAFIYINNKHAEERKSVKHSPLQLQKEKERKPNQENGKTSVMKTPSKEIKDIKDGRTTHVHGLEELIL